MSKNSNNVTVKFNFNMTTFKEGVEMDKVTIESEMSISEVKTFVKESMKSAVAGALAGIEEKLDAEEENNED